MFKTTPCTICCLCTLLLAVVPARGREPAPGDSVPRHSVTAPASAASEAASDPDSGRSGRARLAWGAGFERRMASQPVAGRQVAPRPVGPAGRGGRHGWTD